MDWRGLDWPSLSSIDPPPCEKRKKPEWNMGHLSVSMAKVGMCAVWGVYFNGFLLSLRSDVQSSVDKLIAQRSWWSSMTAEMLVFLFSLCVVLLGYILFELFLSFYIYIYVCIDLYKFNVSTIFYDPTDDGWISRERSGIDQIELPLSSSLPFDSKIFFSSNQI